MKRLALLAVLAFALSGCSSAAPAAGPTDAESAAAVETAFLEALAAGDGEAALALTTLSTEEVACMAVFSEYAELQFGVFGTKTGKATIDEATGHALVGFTYSVGLEKVEEISGTHTLVRNDGEWLIDFPDEYRISVSAPTEVVGQVGVSPIEEIMDGTQLCAAPIDRTYEIPALPGRYTLVTNDPAGVFERSEYVTWVDVSDKPLPETAVELVYIQEEERQSKAAQIRNLITPYIDRCVASGFTDPTCQDGLPVPEGPVSLSEEPNVEDITIFSNDGLTWRYTVGGEDFLFQRNGGIEAFEIFYTGAVIGDGTLYLSITVD